MLATLAALFALSWPTPELTVYRVETEPVAIYLASVEANRNGWRISKVTPTGSMKPLLNGGEYVVGEPYTGQGLHVGMVVIFDRGDTPRVLHMIAVIRGDMVYMSGINNRYSDGWFPKSRILEIARAGYGVK